MNQTPSVLRTYQTAIEVDRRDVEDMVSEQFEFPDFSFRIIESEYGHYLSLSKKDAENEALQDYLSLNSENNDLTEGSDDLEDAAHLLISKLYNLSLQRMVLTDSCQRLLLLA